MQTFFNSSNYKVLSLLNFIFWSWFILLPCQIKNFIWIIWFLKISYVFTLLDIKMTETLLGGYKLGWVITSDRLPNWACDPCRLLISLVLCKSQLMKQKQGALLALRSKLLSNVNFTAKTQWCPENYESGDLPLAYMRTPFLSTNENNCSACLTF